MTLRRCFSLLLSIALLTGGAALAQSPPSPQTPPLPPPRPPASDAHGGEPAQDERKPAQADGGEDASCPTRLTRLGVVFEQRAAIQEGACGGADIVLLSGLPN